MPMLFVRLVAESLLFLADTNSLFGLRERPRPDHEKRRNRIYK